MGQGSKKKVGAGQMGDFLLSSAPIQDPGHLKSRPTGQTGFMKAQHESYVQGKLVIC